MLSLVGGELYQWDTGRIVKVVPDEDVTVHEVHFSTKRMDYAYVLKTYTEDGVTYCAIPNIILQQSSRLLCYEVCENSDGEETIAEATFNITKRNRPEDYVYTEQEHFTVVSLENRLAKVEESAHIHKNKNALDSITNENVETWNNNAEIAHAHENKEQLDTITKADLETWRNPVSTAVTGGAQVGTLFKDLEVTTTLAEDASEWTGASSQPFKCTFRPSPGQTVYANVEGLNTANVTSVNISPEGDSETKTVIGNYSVVNSKVKYWYNDGASNPPTPSCPVLDWCFVFDYDNDDSDFLTPDVPMCTLYTKTPGTYKITVIAIDYSIDAQSVTRMYDSRPYVQAEYGTYANWKTLTESGKYDLWEVAVKKTDYYNGVYLKEVSGTKYVYLYNAEQKYDSDSGTFTNIDHTLTYDTATETVTCSDSTLNPETDVIISVHRDYVLTVPDKCTSLGEATPDKVGKMLTAVDAGGTYNKWQNSRYQYQWVDAPETKTFYADFDVRDGKNITTEVTPDEIVAAYESGQNVIARIVSQLYMSGYVTLVRPFIIERNREISFSDVVVFGGVTSGKMVQLYYDYDSKKWYFDISDWLLDKKHADEKYIDGYWGTDVAGKYLAISDAGVVYAANPPSGSSNSAVTYTEQTLTDDQKKQARANIGAIDASSLEAYAKKTEIPTVPTKVSAFENDSGYLTEHQSLDAYAKKTEIPTKTSQLTNDSGYLTEHQSLDAYAKKTEIPNAVTYTEQTLTDDQKAQARNNIGAQGIKVASAYYMWVNTSPHTNDIYSVYNTGASIGTISGQCTPDSDGNSIKTPVTVIFGSVSRGYVDVLAISAEGTMYSSTLKLSSESQPILHKIKNLTLNDDNTLSQQVMSAAPTEDMHIATKEYIDTSLNNFASAVLEFFAKKTEIPTVPTTDSELSTTSTNPVQNKIVKAELDKKLESIPVDGTTIKLNDQGQLTLALTNANGVSF